MVRFNLPAVDRFLFGMSLRTGGIFIGNTMMLFSCAGLFLDGFAAFGRPDNDGIRGLQYASAGLSVVGVFANLLLHYGTLTRNCCLLVFWMGWSAMMLLFNFIHCIVIFSNLKIPIEYASGFRSLIHLVVIYFIIVVYSLTEQLKKEQQSELKNKAVDENGTDEDKEPMMQTA